MISYQNAKEIIEILTSGINCDTNNWIKFFTDVSEVKNATPEPSEVEHICIKYFEKYKANDGKTAPIAIIDIDLIYGESFSLSINDFTHFDIANILKNLERAHNCMKLK